MYFERYSLEKDIESLQYDGKIVLARTLTTKGWAILWYDKQGYTVTYTERNGRGVGGAMPFEVALTDYLETVRRLV